MCPQVIIYDNDGDGDGDNDNVVDGDDKRFHKSHISSAPVAVRPGMMEGVGRPQSQRLRNWMCWNRLIQLLLLSSTLFLYKHKT